MVAVAQLLEPRIVIPVVVGSSPISHPNLVILQEHSQIALLCSFIIILQGNHYLTQDTFFLEFQFQKAIRGYWLMSQGIQFSL